MSWRLFFAWLRFAAGVTLGLASTYDLSDLPEGAWLEATDEFAPMGFAVWLDDDLIGCGHTAEQALADARATVKVWADGGAT